MIFDYSGKIYYIHENKMKLRYMPGLSNELSKAYKFLQKMKLPLSNFTVGGDYKKIVLVVKSFDKFIRLEFNHRLESINRKYDIKADEIHPIDFLENEMEINHGIHSLRKKYGTKEDVIYPHKFRVSIGGMTHLDYYRAYPSDASIGCYDKYEDTLVSMTVETGIVYMYEWKREGDTWKRLRKIATIDMIQAQLTQITISHLECSREHIIIHISNTQSTEYWNQYGKNRICIFDKFTLQEVDNFNGCCPVSVDLYKEWYDERLNFLSKLEMLEKMTVSLLRIILSYVS